MERIALAGELPDDRLGGNPNNLPPRIGDRTCFISAALNLNTLDSGTERYWR
jgi:hypothetical protein